jgi:hypothetical protein
MEGGIGNYHLLYEDENYDDYPLFVTKDIAAWFTTKRTFECKCGAKYKKERYLSTGKYSDLGRDGDY